MKKKLFFGLFLLIGLFSSCGTLDVATEHSSRAQYIRGGDLIGEDKIAKIDVDFSRRIHATSNWQATKSAAREEAEHMAIRENQIDVVVDPIWKYTISPIFSRAGGAPWHFAYKAELLGYAGMYKKAISHEEMIQQLKEIDMETIEKYKLLTDPNYQPYAQPEDNSVNGSIILNGTGGNFAPVSFNPSTLNVEDSKSLVVKPIEEIKPTKQKDYFKVGTQKIKAGKAFVGMGTPILTAGLVSWISADIYQKRHQSDWYHGSSDERDKLERANEAWVTGMSLFVMGAAFEIIGIPCWCVGNKDLRRANGESLTFNYQVAPTGVGFALNF